MPRSHEEESRLSSIDTAGGETIPAISPTVALRLLTKSGLPHRQAVVLIDKISSEAVTVVPGTPRRKGLHRLIPLAVLLKARPQLSPLFPSFLTEEDQPKGPFGLV